MSPPGKAQDTLFLHHNSWSYRVSSTAELQGIFNFLVPLKGSTILLSSSVFHFSAKVIEAVGWLSPFQDRKAKTFNLLMLIMGSLTVIVALWQCLEILFYLLHFHSWRIIKFFYYLFQLGWVKSLKWQIFIVKLPLFFPDFFFNF